MKVRTATNNPKMTVIKGVCTRKIHGKKVCSNSIPVFPRICPEFDANGYVVESPTGHR